MSVFEHFENHKGDPYDFVQIIKRDPYDFGRFKKTIFNFFFKFSKKLIKKKSIFFSKKNFKFVLIFF